MVVPDIDESSALVKACLVGVKQAVFCTNPVNVGVLLEWSEINRGEIFEDGL